MTKILITGGAGFIGSHLTAKLLEGKNNVVCIDDFNNYYPPQFKKENIASFLTKKNYQLYHGDIRDEKILKKVFIQTKPEIVIHLAARAGIRASIAEPRLYFDVNLIGTLNLLELARKSAVSQFIFGSSSSVYGNCVRVPFWEGEQNLQPISPYGISKLAAEKEAYLYHLFYNLPITILRFFTVYGQRGRPDMAPYLFTEAVLEGKPIKKFGPSTSRRDYTYIEDIVDGIIAATKKRFKFEIINLGNSTPVTLNKFIGTVEKVVGKKAKIENYPAQPGDVTQTFADIRKAKKMLGWKPHTTLENGLKKFFEWYCKSGRVTKNFKR